jgi:hypothetical protein
VQYFFYWQIFAKNFSLKIWFQPIQRIFHEKKHLPKFTRFSNFKKLPNCQSLMITSTNVAKKIEGFIFYFLKTFISIM